MNVHNKLLVDDRKLRFRAMCGLFWAITLFCSFSLSLSAVTFFVVPFVDGLAIDRTWDDLVKVQGCKGDLVWNMSFLDCFAEDNFHQILRQFYKLFESIRLWEKFLKCIVELESVRKLFAIVLDFYHTLNMNIVLGRPFNLFPYFYTMLHILWSKIWFLSINSKQNIASRVIRKYFVENRIVQVSQPVRMASLSDHCCELNAQTPDINHAMNALYYLVTSILYLDNIFLFF